MRALKVFGYVLLCWLLGSVIGGLLVPRPSWLLPLIGVVVGFIIGLRTTNPTPDDEAVRLAERLATTAAPPAGDLLSSAPAGWYADTEGSGQRYWDGTAWTGHTAN